VQFDGEKPDKITRGACACNDDKVIFENPSDLLRSRVSCSRHELGLKGMGRYVPHSVWAEQKTSREAAAEKQQSITLVNQSFDERKIVVLLSAASDKTAKQNESDDHFQ
jgi:hypothetical protein